MRPGLERIKSALEEIRPLLTHTKIVIIAGTNGKGETTLRLSQLLKGHHHFAWTSPHILRLTERMRSEKGEISNPELESLVLECHQKLSLKKIDLSYYEFLFFVFCSWAVKSSPEYLLLEVGLGGRLDAVNVFDADLVLLPSISRDHQEILGRRYDQILTEKLGTLRHKSTLIHFLDNNYLSERAEITSLRLGVKVISLKSMIDLPPYEFSLRNQLLAGAAYCFLQTAPFDPSVWNKSVPILENRGEILKNDLEWYFFGSHNIDGLRKLIQFLHHGTYNFGRPPFDTVIVAFSKRNPVDLRVMLRMLLKSQIGKIVVTVFDHPKAASLQEIELLSREEGSEFVQDIETYILGQKKNQRMLVTGSYYFLGHVKSLLGRR